MSQTLAQAPRQRARKKRPGNRERIVDAAIFLMNEHGGGVGTRQIADHLEISPGNLYYHYRNFFEIVGEILVRLRRELANVLAMPEQGPVSAQDLVGYYSNGAIVLWRYRFLFSSASELTKRDESLAEGCRAFRAEGIEAVRRIIADLVKHHPGPVKASARDCEKLAENMWVLWSAWPRHAEHSLVNGQVSRTDIARGLEQIALTLVPYLDPDFEKQVRRGLRRFVDTLEIETWSAPTQGAQAAE